MRETEDKVRVTGNTAESYYGLAVIAGHHCRFVIQPGDVLRGITIGSYYEPAVMGRLEWVLL